MATTVPARLRGLQRLLDRIPLRTKLVSASLLLVAVALILSSVAGIAFLRDYLGNRVDAQLELLAERGGPPRRGPGPDMSRGRVDLPSAFVLKYLDADGNTLYDNSWLLREG